MSWTFAIERASPAARRSHRSLWNYAVLLQPIWPLVIGIGIGIAQLARREDVSVPRALRTALLICLECQVAAIAGAALAGINLLRAR